MFDAVKGYWSSIKENNLCLEGKKEEPANCKKQNILKYINVVSVTKKKA